MSNRSRICGQLLRKGRDAPVFAGVQQRFEVDPEMLLEVGRELAAALVERLGEPR